MSESIKLFSDVFEQNKSDPFFDKGTIKGAYLIGAYSKAIIDGSYHSKVAAKNETFKKWLSNQQIIQKNLKKIFNKAHEFERKLQLASKRNEDLSILVTTHFKETGKKVVNQEVSFAFIRGYNDYAIFKKENSYEGEKNDNGKTE